MSETVKNPAPTPEMIRFCEGLLKLCQEHGADIGTLRSDEGVTVRLPSGCCLSDVDGDAKTVGADYDGGEISCTADGCRWRPTQWSHLYGGERSPEWFDA